MRKFISKAIVVSLLFAPQTVWAQETTDDELQLLEHCEDLARGQQSENRSSANLIDELGLCFTYIKEISALRKEFSEIGSFDFNTSGLEAEETAGSEEQPQSRKFLNADEVEIMIQQSIESLHNELILEQSLQDSSLNDFELEADAESAIAEDVSSVDLEAAYVGQIKQDNIEKHIVVVTGQFVTLSEGDRIANQVFEKRLDGFYLGGDKLVDYAPAEASDEDQESIESILEQV